ncbi:ADP-glucose pyrophosphorylase large subunit 4 [Sesbania bispinosa]|nr:ADP-glucose pyrophosphorylase large subunit 4 [Sesbania bispinosa]
MKLKQVDGESSSDGLFWDRDRDRDRFYYFCVLAATQTPGEAGKNWFQGAADAVRQFHWLFEDPKSKDIEDVLILSGMI